VNVDAQTESSHLDLIGGGNLVVLDRLAVDQRAHDGIVVLHYAGFTIEA
jgi:hypothetical protein